MKYLFFFLITLIHVKIGFAQKRNGNQLTKTPNIIYIYADDLGYGELGAYGQTKIKTPHLDRLAKEGMRFTQHYSGAPVCAPSRAMLMTGKHSGHVAIRGNFELGGFKDEEERGQMPLPAEEITIAELLKRKGYATALIGKWGLGMADTHGSPSRQGFDYYYGVLDQKQAHNFYPSHLWENDQWDTLPQPWLNVHKKLDPITASDVDFEYFKGTVYAPQKMTEKALQFIERNQENPFFLYMPYTLPHVSLQVPDEYVARYKGLFDEQPYYGAKGYASTKYPLSTYAGMITYLDDQVGLLLDKIKALGIDDSTIIFFSSDNGTTFNGGVDAAFFNSVAGLRGLKMDLYEGGIRVPFIARWPTKIKAGSSSHHISAQYDMFATIAELSGQSVDQTDGISLVPALLGKTKRQQKHPFLYFEYPEKGGQLAIRMGKWKGVKTDVKKNPTKQWELYNLDKDPYEQHDVALQNPAILQELDKIVKQEHTPSGIDRWDFVREVIK